MLGKILMILREKYWIEYNGGDLDVIEKCLAAINAKNVTVFRKDQNN